jgi:hypothetical protein
MGDEADALWDSEMIEEGREFMQMPLHPCEAWPRCACGYDTSTRAYDVCGPKSKRSRP